MVQRLEHKTENKTVFLMMSDCVRHHLKITYLYDRAAMGVRAITLVCMFSTSKKLINANLKDVNCFQNYAYLECTIGQNFWNFRR